MPKRKQLKDTSKVVTPPARLKLPGPLPGQTQGASPRGRLAARKPNGQAAPYQPTDQDRMTVVLAAGHGMSQETIARLVRWPVGLDLSTLRRHFASELNLGKEWVDHQVNTQLFRLTQQNSDLKAKLGGITWYQKTRQGLREPAHEAPRTAATVEVGATPTSAPMRFTLAIEPPVGAERNDGETA